MKIPYIVDVRRNALDDGPGIRSVVFFKGCPLRCQWCQNPETLSPGPQLQREADRCADCGACVSACPEGTARPASMAQSPRSCRSCGACVDACPTAARRIVGRRRELEEVLALLLRDEPFYRRSGGGVTLSGGEPTLYAELAGALAASLRERGIHVLLETSGFFDWEPFEEHLLPHLSTVYFDLKLAREEDHRRYTGKGNRKILKSFRRLVEGASELELLPRVPLIPGITDGTENLEAIARLIAESGLSRVSLLSYNPLWIEKRRSLGLELSYEHRRWMEPEQVERCRSIFRKVNLEVL